MPLPAGTRIGPYEITAALGAGGMGEVYKARDTKLHRAVAIKALQATVATDAERIARFEREVQITCKLNNPSTIAIYDYGRTPEGVFYYAMEYLDGLDLQQLVDRHEIPEGLAHLLALDLQEAVVHPHVGHDGRAVGAAALGDLVLVVGEDEVDAAAVDVEHMRLRQPRR